MKPLVLAIRCRYACCLGRRDRRGSPEEIRRFLEAGLHRRSVSYQNVKGKPSGIITYDNTGHMSVQIVLGERPAFSDARAKASDKEKAAAYGTYVGYYGTYTFEPENRIVIHHLEGSIVPSQIGRDNIRYFELNGNRLTLSVANNGRGGRLARKDTTAHLTWEKIPAK